MELTIVKRSSGATLTAPRSKTPFIIVLLAGLTATVAAAFMRDNMRRGSGRQDQQPPSNVDSLVREAVPPLVTGSEPVHGAAEHMPHSRTSEAHGGSQIPTITVPRRSARSSG